MDNRTIEINENALRMMKMKINGAERLNAKTKEKNDKKMIEKIQTIIEEECQCL